VARLLGLDVGAQRTGVAVSDPSGILAFPLTTLTRSSEARHLEAIMELARQKDAEAIVVGLPISLDGSLHTQGQEVQALIEKLQAISPIPVEPWDERFSTAEAERLLREVGAQPSRERGRVDAAAAAIILQSYLDTHRTGLP